jgi:hypothetical protein
LRGGNPIDGGLFAARLVITCSFGVVHGPASSSRTSSGASDSVSTVRGQKQVRGEAVDHLRCGPRLSAPPRALCGSAGASPSRKTPGTDHSAGVRGPVFLVQRAGSRLHWKHLRSVALLFNRKGTVHDHPRALPLL